MSTTTPTKPTPTETEAPQKPYDTDQQLRAQALVDAKKVLADRTSGWGASEKLPANACDQLIRIASYIVTGRLPRHLDEMPRVDVAPCSDPEEVAAHVAEKLRRADVEAGEVE